MRFNPGCASRFFNFPVASITDQIVPLDSIWGSRAKEIEQKLMDLNTWQGRMNLLQEWLLKVKLETSPSPSLSYFAWAWENAPFLSVEKIAETVGVTRQHLRRIFLEHSGLTPKDFIQISRVHRLTKLGPSGLSSPEMGFYDQSHLIHQFKKYTGLTPGAYFRTTGKEPSLSLRL